MTPRADAAPVFVDLNIDDAAAAEAGEGMKRGGQWRVQKFGGTCVSAAERIASAAQLVLQGAERGERQASYITHILHSCICSEYVNTPQASMGRRPRHEVRVEQRNLACGLWPMGRSLFTLPSYWRQPVRHPASSRGRAEDAMFDEQEHISMCISVTSQMLHRAAQVVVVSAMGSHPSSPVKVTDLLLNMVSKAVRQDEAFLLDLAALQVEFHVRSEGRLAFVPIPLKCASSALLCVCAVAQVHAILSHQLACILVKAASSAGSTAAPAAAIGTDPHVIERSTLRCCTVVLSRGFHPTCHRRNMWIRQSRCWATGGC